MFRILLFLFVLCSLVSADCGCGFKCANYSDASRCTRCCTATVKRSLFSKPLLTRGHRFLLPDSESPSYRTPMWLQQTQSRQVEKTRSPRIPIASQSQMFNKLESILEFLQPASSLPTIHRRQRYRITTGSDDLS